MGTDKATWLEKLKGRFIVFDGPDGCGKSTQAGLFCQAARQVNVPVCVLRDPGGTGIGEQIRQILLDSNNLGMSFTCEMLLYMASRAQLVDEMIQPAREKQQIVLADRFISSTLAYQGAAGGISARDIVTVGHIALGRHWPDMVVVLDVDSDTAKIRMKTVPDRIEQRDQNYHDAVRKGFIEQVQQDPDHYLLIDASPPAETVFADLMDALKHRTEDW